MLKSISFTVLLIYALAVAVYAVVMAVLVILDKIGEHKYGKLRNDGSKNSTSENNRKRQDEIEDT